VAGLILEIHGAVDDFDDRRLDHRRMLDLAVLGSALASLPFAFVDLETAVHGEGVALTVDDATRAGMRAALLASALGHRVTIFVNPHNVIAGLDYTFTQVNSILSTTGRDLVDWNGARFYLPADGEELRMSVKRELLSLADEAERQKVVASLATAAAPAAVCSDHLRVLTEDELTTMAASGVAIGNHCWTHTNHAILTPSQVADEVTRSASWLLHRYPQAVVRDVVAVPYGKATPSAECVDSTGAVFLLADDRLPPGHHRRGVLNRSSVDVLPDPSSLRGHISTEVRRLV
jgi:hypothetical protein